MGELVPFPDRRPPVVKAADGNCRKCGQPIAPGTMYAPGPEHIGACPSSTAAAKLVARMTFFGPGRSDSRMTRFLNWNCNCSGAL